MICKYDLYTITTIRPLITGKSIEEQIADPIEDLKQKLGKDVGTLQNITEHTNPKDALPYIAGKLQNFLEKGKL